jgi:CheY-like chemotaxis protein
MKEGIQILAVELDGRDGIVVTFSDGKTGGYVVEELLELRPVRERVKTKKIPNVPKVQAR